MPSASVTRSIKLKLVVPRTPEKQDLRRCLWATHAVPRFSVILSSWGDRVR